MGKMILNFFTWFILMSVSGTKSLATIERKPLAINKTGNVFNNLQRSCRNVIVHAHHVLNRRKRYIVYPKGSFVGVTISNVKALIFSFPTGYNLLNEIDILYELPDKPRYFIKKNTTVAKTPMISITTKPTIPLNNEIVIDNSAYLHKNIYWNDVNHDLSAEVFAPPGGWVGDSIPYFEHPSPSPLQIFQNVIPWYSDRQNRVLNSSFPKINQELYKSNTYSNRKVNQRSIWQTPIYATTWRSLAKKKYIAPHNLHERSVPLKTNKTIQSQPFDIEDHQDWENYHRYKDRREFYKYIEDIFKHNGLPIKTCILRAICESSNSSFLQGKSLVYDIFRIIFRIPIKDEMNDDYSNAMRNNINNVDCRNIYEDGCPISFLDIFLTSKKVV